MNNQTIADCLYSIILNLRFLRKSDCDEIPENNTDKAYRRDDQIETDTFHYLLNLIRDKHFSQICPDNTPTTISDIGFRRTLHLKALDAIEYCWDMGTDFQDDYQIIDSNKVRDLLGIYSINYKGFPMVKMNTKKRKARPDTRYFDILATLLGSIYSALPIQSRYDKGNKSIIDSYNMSEKDIEQSIKDAILGHFKR